MVRDRLVRLGTIVAAFTAVLLAPGGAVADVEGGGANHVVIALSTADGASQERSGLQVAPAGGPTVASDNLAVATSGDCTGCRTVAVAFQAVLVTGDPDTVTPLNAAAATTANCTGCASFAYAYQYVLSTRGPVHLSPEGQSRVATIREELAEAASSDLAFPALEARLDQLSAELKAVIDAELVQANAVATRRVDVAPVG